MVYSFIHINEKPCYARDRDGIIVEVYEVRVGDADPIYMDRIGRTHCSSLCFDTKEELRDYYHDCVYVVHDWWSHDEEDTDSIFTDKDKAMQRAKEILKAGNSYGVWIDAMQLNKPDCVERIYTEKNND